jgi:hypothetical protein
LMGYAESDAAAQAQVTAMRQELRKLGWDEGRNIHIDVGPNQMLIAGPTPGNVSMGAASGPVPGSGGVAIRVAISTADPSTFHAIVVSLCWKAPTIDQVTPPLSEKKNGFGAPKLAAHICVGSIGSTPMLGSAFCAVSALALAGIRSTARRRNGKLDVAVMDHSFPLLPSKITCRSRHDHSQSSIELLRDSARRVPPGEPFTPTGPKVHANRMPFLPQRA